MSSLTFSLPAGVVGQVSISFRTCSTRRRRDTKHSAAAGTSTDTRSLARLICFSNSQRISLQKGIKTLVCWRLPLLHHSFVFVCCLWFNDDTTSSSSKSTFTDRLSLTRFGSRKSIDYIVQKSAFSLARSLSCRLALARALPHHVEDCRTRFLFLQQISGGRGGKNEPAPRGSCCCTTY